MNATAPSRTSPVPQSSSPGWSLRSLLAGPLPARRRFLFLLLRAACWLALCIFFLPTSFFELPGFGAEPSWKLALQRAVTEGWGFGQRIIWTYGPLGLLEWRYPFNIPMAWYLAFDLLLLALFLRFAFDVSRAPMDKLTAAAALASLFTAKRMIHDQPSVAVYCVLLYLVVRNLARPNFLDAAALVVVSVLLLFFKMNFGLLGFFLAAVALVALAKIRSKNALTWAGILAAQIAVAWISAAAFHTHLLAYLKSSFAIVRQYNDMTWGPGPGGVAHWVVFGLFWCLVALAANQIRKSGFHNRTVLYWIIGCAAGFLLYKTAIIRSDYNHNKCFLLGFPLLCLVFLIHGPPEIGRAWRFLFLASTAYTSLLMVAEFGNALIYMRQDYLKVFFPVNYVEGLRNYHSYSTWNDYVALSQANDPARLVPPAVRQRIGTNTVDVFPFEASLAIASSLHYQPRPIPLTYGVMGPGLESRNLAFLRSAEAPAFILYVLGDRAYSIDGRYHLWEEPAVKRLLARDYRPELVFTNIQGAQPEIEPAPSPVLLLRRTAQPTQPELENSPAGKPAGLEVTVPSETAELYASIHLHKTWLGRLVSFLYRGSEVSVQFTLNDGTVRELRVLPADLESGVLLNYFADGANPQHLLNYLFHQSRGNPQCLKVEFRPQRKWAYRSELDIAYSKAPP